MSESSVYRAESRPAMLGGKNAEVVRFPDERGEPMTWPRVADALVSSPEFVTVWSAAWNRPRGLMWKPLPFHETTRDAPFFAVIIDARFRAADASAFAKQLGGLSAKEHVVTFPNLRGDSTLVVPASRGDYGHLGAYSANASADEEQAFWRAAGKEAKKRMKKRSAFWCNTHGHGVPWLHVRFDTTHKYPSFSPRGAIDATSGREWLGIYATAFG